MARFHYITKEDTQNMKNQLMEYRTFLRKQASIARLAKADKLYAETNKELDELMVKLDKLGNSLDSEDFDRVRDALQSLDGKLIQYQGAVHDMYRIANQEEGGQPGERPEQELTQKLEGLSGIVRSQIADFERRNNLEQNNAEANHSEEMMSIYQAESLTMKTSQKVLRGIAKAVLNNKAQNLINTSGYGVLYDTLTECISIIDRDNDLTTLAGREYSQFKQAVKSWKQSVENVVRNGEFSNEETQDAIVNLDNNVESFFNRAQSYTRAFDELGALIKRECANMRTVTYRQEGILYKDLLNGKYPDEPLNTDRERLEDDIITSDINQVKNPPSYIVKGAEQYNDMVELQMFANRIMMDEPYEHNGQMLQGEALRNELKKYEVFSLSEITRHGNESVPLLASLYNKGLTVEQLVHAAKKPDAPENVAIIKLMKETRKEILDIAMTDDLKAADEKISDLVVTTLLRIENEIGELKKNPSNENIAAFAISKMNMKSFLEQGIPRNVYTEDGSQFIRDSVDRKLKAAGKPYTFDEIYGMISTLSYVSAKFTEVKNGSATLDTANVIANQTFMVRNLLNKMAQKPTTGEAIKLFDKDYDFRVGNYNVGENDRFEGIKYYVENKGVMKDTLYKLGVYSGEKLMKDMEKQIELHGASSRFQKVFDTLQVIQAAEQRGYKQEYINHYYNQLERFCNEYLDHRNPWRENGKERYKLITRIGAFAEASRAHRLELAKEERALNRERDISHREVHNNFLAKTDSFFGDSDKMKAIKRISEKIEFNQLHGMVIPADGGDVNWYKLVKACADYLADPSKRDNSRRDAVREMMANAMGAGHFNDENLNRALIEATPGVEGGREQVALAIKAYEEASRARVAKLAKEREQEVLKKSSIDSLINNSIDIGRMYVANENNLYVDSIFGLNPVPEETMQKAGVYRGENDKEYQADEIVLSEEAKKGLAALGLSAKDFGLLAYAEFSMNSYVVDSRKVTDVSDKSAAVIHGLFHENIAGNHFRQNIMESLSVNASAFKAARTNTKAMLEKIGAGNPPDITEMAAMMGKMLNFIKLNPREIYVAGYTGEQCFIKQMMKLMDAKKEFRQAIFDSKNFSEKDYLMMKGVAVNADYENAAAYARIKVVSAIKSGYVLSKQEMKDCYRAILKTGVTWTESVASYRSYLNNNDKIKKLEQDYDKALEEYRKARKELRVAKENGKKKEELDALQKRVDGKNTILDGIVKSMSVTNNPKDVSRPILSFIGTTKGREMYEKLIESFIPENITMEDLYEISNPSHMFAKEHKAMDEGLPKQLQELKDKNNPDKAIEKEGQELEEAPKQAEKQKEAVKHI